MTSDDIEKIIQGDPWMMRVLLAVREIGLPDWWIGAGFVRNKVWNHLHGFKERTPVSDMDVVYFDRSDLSEEAERPYEQELERRLPTGLWSVTNQARMHAFNGHEPYASSLDAVRHWPETATAVAVRLDEAGNVRLGAPLGIHDLTSLVVRPSPAYENRLDAYCARVQKKHWKSKWPKLDVRSCA